MTSFNEEM